MIEADIFNKVVQGNIPKPLRNLYITFDVNTLRHCGEMACVEESLHTFGNSDITIVSVLNCKISQMACLLCMLYASAIIQSV